MLSKEFVSGVLERRPGYILMWAPRFCFQNGEKPFFPPEKPPKCDVSIGLECLGTIHISQDNDKYPKPMEQAWLHPCWGAGDNCGSSRSTRGGAGCHQDHQAEQRGSFNESPVRASPPPTESMGWEEQTLLEPPSFPGLPKMIPL